jgi:hypothetical protein
MASPGQQIEISPEATRQSLMEISKVTPDPVKGTEGSSKLPNVNVEGGAATKCRSNLISISYTKPTRAVCENNVTDQSADQSSF